MYIYRVIKKFQPSVYRDNSFILSFFIQQIFIDYLLHASYCPSKLEILVELKNQKICSNREVLSKMWPLKSWESLTFPEGPWSYPFHCIAICSDGTKEIMGKTAGVLIWIQASNCISNHFLQIYTYLIKILVPTLLKNVTDVAVKIILPFATWILFFKCSESPSAKYSCNTSAYSNTIVVRKSTGAIVEVVSWNSCVSMQHHFDLKRNYWQRKCSYLDLGIWQIFSGKWTMWACDFKENK